jgi:hypothetical protein
MKKILFLFASLLSLCHVYAGDTLSVGYCKGVVNKNSNIEIAGSGWVHSAIYLPSSKLDFYYGNQIVAVNAGLSSRVNIDTLRVWLRTSLNGSNVAEGIITSTENASGQRIVRGWNSVPLSVPYTICKGQPIYIGYSFKQRGTTKAVAVVQDSTDNGYFGKTIGEDEWTDNHKSGTLCIEGIVTGSNLPKFDVALNTVDIMDTNGSTMNVIANVSNDAVNTINGFSLSISVNGSNEVISKHFDESLSNGETKDINFTIEPKDKDKYYENDITATINSIDGATDENSGNNAVTARLSFYKRALAEEFTTENCPNCPRVAGYLASALSNSAYDGRVFAVCHHSGFGSDWLSVAADKDYEWFYGGEIFAPAMMFDRYAYGHGPYDVAAMIPILLPSSATEITSYFDDRLSQRAYADVNITAAYADNDNNKINVHVTGRCSSMLADNISRITVYLTEDSIAPHSQAGTTGTFYHNHVLRAYNSTWGDVIDLSARKYSYNCTFDIDPSFNRQRMHIVAFINAYDSSDTGNCKVENVNGLNVRDISTGIENINNGDMKRISSIDYFSIDGTQISKPVDKGIYIVKTNYDNGSSFTHKEVKR